MDDADFPRSKRTERLATVLRRVAGKLTAQKIEGGSAAVVRDEPRMDIGEGDRAPVGCESAAKVLAPVDSARGGKRSDDRREGIVGNLSSLRRLPRIAIADQRGGCLAIQFVPTKPLSVRRAAGRVHAIHRARPVDLV